MEGAEGISPEEMNELATEWRKWLDSPQNRAALMQFGISLMQPIGVGQSTLGHFGQALGSAVEARDRMAEQELREQDIASRAAAREALATARESQAAVLEERARSNAAREALQKERNATERLKALHKMYEAEIKALTDPLRRKSEPVPSFEEWLQRKGLDVSAGIVPKAKAPPKIGEVHYGYRYLGGPPSDPKSWQKVGN